MDAAGWLPLSVLANMNRVKALTNDEHMLRKVCRAEPCHIAHPPCSWRHRAYNVHTAGRWRKHAA